MTNPYPQPQQVRTCLACGQAALQPRNDPITRKRKTNHIFHLLMGLLTLTIWWWTVWPVMAIGHAFGKETVGVDRYVVCVACGARQT